MDWIMTCLSEIYLMIYFHDDPCVNQVQPPQMAGQEIFHPPLVCPVLTGAGMLMDITWDMTKNLLPMADLKGMPSWAQL